MTDDTVSSTELTPIREALPPAEISTPAEAELELRRHQAILDVMRRGRAELRDQVVVLRRCIEYAVRGVDLVDEMRVAGQLVQHGGDRRSTPDVRGMTLDDVDLDDRRVSEWRSLRDNGALAFLDQALADGREETFKRGSINWVRERVERIARETATPIDYEPSYDFEVRHGDLRDTLDDLAGTVDAIITDPPYGAAFLDEYDALGDLAKRLLRPNGVFVAMVGHMHLSAILERLGQHLEYRWIGAYLTPGPATHVHARAVGTRWKPLIIYGGNRFLPTDVFTSLAADKRHHHWGQSESGMAEIVERMTRPGELVVDPFLGAGTTAVVCHELGRRFAGCDIDAAAVHTARARLNG